MEIVKLKKEKSNKYKLILSDNTSLSFYDDVILKYDLLFKKKIAKNELEEIIKYNNKLNAYHKSLNLIFKKLRTKKEIEKYLINEDKEYIKYAIDRLEKEGYISDDRYIKAYINDKITLTLWGPLKIKRELEKLSFNNELIYDYLEQIDKEIWNKRIEKCILKKEKTNHKLTKLMLKNKLKSELLLNGYELEMINNIIDNYSFKDDNEALTKNVIEKERKKLSRKYSGEELEYRLKISLYKKGIELKN